MATPLLLKPFKAVPSSSARISRRPTTAPRRASRPRPDSPSSAIRRRPWSRPSTACWRRSRNSPTPAEGLGFLNWLPDNDRVVRRVPLLLAVNGQIQPSLVLETLRVAQGATGYIVKSTTAYGSTAGKTDVIDSIKDGDVIVPVQADGQLRVWFGKSDPRRSIPAWKVLQPGADLSELAGKIVLIGASASLLTDIVATPTRSVDAGGRGSCPAHRADPFRRDAGAARLGARRGIAGRRGDVADRRGASAVRPDLCDGGRRGHPRSGHGLRQLERLYPSGRADRPALPEHRRGLRVPRRRRAALRPEAPAGERDPLGLRSLRIARGGRPARRTPRAAAARRREARPQP